MSVARKLRRAIERQRVSVLTDKGALLLPVLREVEEIARLSGVTEAQALSFLLHLAEENLIEVSGDKLEPARKAVIIAALRGQAGKLA